MLYGNGYAQTTGAVYRLLQRSGVVHDSLALKKACVQQGTVTQDEFDCLRGHLGDVRSFTLIPLVALRTALSVFGCDERYYTYTAVRGRVYTATVDTQRQHSVVSQYKSCMYETERRRVADGCR